MLVKYDRSVNTDDRSVNTVLSLCQNSRIAVLNSAIAVLIQYDHCVFRCVNTVPLQR